VTVVTISYCMCYFGRLCEVHTKINTAYRSHPPYKDCVNYSDNLEGDISLIPGIQEFQNEMSKVANESWR
jgi:hypothetical protein